MGDSVHQALGGGSVADVLLWRNRSGAVTLMISSSALWFLFERAGYNLVSFGSNVLLLLIVILFLWAKSASIFNRPLPPVPDMELSEAVAIRAADGLQVWINSVLSIACEIAISRNWIRLLQVAFVLCIVSYVGSLFNFLTLVYLGVLLSLSIPVLYEKYRDHIDDKLNSARRVIQSIRRNILRPVSIEKKSQ